MEGEGRRRVSDRFLVGDMAISFYVTWCTVVSSGLAVSELHPDLVILASNERKLGHFNISFLFCLFTF